MSQLAISNSGPHHELHVYIRASGDIVWRAKANGDAEKHAQLLEEAERVVHTGNALITGSAAPKPRSTGDE